MAKRGSDADSRVFFDELVSLTASRLRATGAIRLEDRRILFPFGERTKLIHTPGIGKQGPSNAIKGRKIDVEDARGKTARLELVVKI
jgi:hypothetical protein